MSDWVNLHLCLVAPLSYKWNSVVEIPAPVGLGKPWQWPVLPSGRGCSTQDLNVGLIISAATTYPTTLRCTLSGKTACSCMSAPNAVSSTLPKSCLPGLLISENT
eukprot:g60811.t1